MFSSNNIGRNKPNSAQINTKPINASDSSNITNPDARTVLPQTRQDDQTTAADKPESDP